MNNIDQLRAEITRLESKRVEQEQALRKRVSDLGEQLRPVNLLLSALSSITGIKFHSDVFQKDGMLHGISLLFQRFILKIEKKAEETVYGMVDYLFDRIQSFMRKQTGYEAKREERKDASS